MVKGKIFTSVKNDKGEKIKDVRGGEVTLGTAPNIIGVTATGLNPGFLSADPLGPNDLLTVSESLQCLTINGAASLGLENERGSIEVGKYAVFAASLQITSINHRYHIYWSTGDYFFSILNAYVQTNKFVYTQ